MLKAEKEASPASNCRVSRCVCVCAGRLAKLASGGFIYATLAPG